MSSVKLPAAAAAVVVLGLGGCGRAPPTADAPLAVGATGASATVGSTPIAAAAAPAASAQVFARALAVRGSAEAQVVEAVRSGGVLTLRVRFQRTQGSTGSGLVYSTVTGNAIYLVGGANKIFPLTDSEGKPLVPPDLFLQLGTDTPLAGLWFGKFPAPPADVKTVSLVLPNVEPLDNIPLTDR